MMQTISLILGESPGLPTSVSHLEQESGSNTTLSDYAELCTSTGEFCVENEQSVEQVAALFLLTLKQKYKLTQASLDFLVSPLTNIVNMAVRNIKESVYSQLSEIGQNNDLSLSSCFLEIDLFF